MLSDGDVVEPVDVDQSLVLLDGRDCRHTDGP